MGGLDLSIVFQVGTHEGASCPYAKYDSAVATIIKELENLATSCCDSSESEDADPLTCAKNLKAKLPELAACRILQFFKNDWPTTELTDVQRSELLDKNSSVFEDEDDDKCEACRKNMMCLSSAALSYCSSSQGGIGDVIPWC